MRTSKTGFTYVKIAIALFALTMIAAAVAAARSYLNGVDERGYQRGVAETSDAWRKRAAMEQAEFQEAYDALRAEMDESVRLLNSQLHEATTAYEREKKDHEEQRAKNDRVERDLRSGRLVLVDRGARRAPTDEACRSKGPAAPAATASGDAAPEPEPGELSRELAEFLWGEAARADEVIEDLEERLTFAQDVIGAYYRIAHDCISPNPR